MLSERIVRNCWCEVLIYSFTYRCRNKITKMNDSQRLGRQPIVLNWSVGSDPTMFWFLWGKRGHGSDRALVAVNISRNGYGKMKVIRGQLSFFSPWEVWRKKVKVVYYRWFFHISVVSLGFLFHLFILLINVFSTWEIIE